MIAPTIDLVSACYMLVIIIGIYHVQEQRFNALNIYAIAPGIRPIKQIQEQYMYALVDSSFSSMT